MFAQPNAVRAEGIGQDDLAACLHIGAGDFADAVGMGQVPSIREVPQRETARLQFGPPRAVGDHQPV